MDSAAVAPLPALVAGLPFGIAFAFGAIAEIANFGDWKRRRIWMMAIGVAIVGTTVRATLRLIDHSKSTFTGARVARGRRG